MSSVFTGISTEMSGALERMDGLSRYSVDASGVFGYLGELSEEIRSATRWGF